MKVWNASSRAAASPDASGESSGSTARLADSSMPVRASPGGQGPSVAEHPKAHQIWRALPSQYGARTLLRWILPASDLGNSVTKSRLFGALKPGRLALAKARISSASAAPPPDPP